MTLLDYAVLGVLVLSVAWGAWRGIVREVAALAGWVIAFLAANLFAGPLGERLPESLASTELRVLGAFVGIFIASLIVTSVAGLLLSKIMQAVGLGTLDRGLGALFGVARAALVVVAFGLVAGLTSLPQHAVWTHSLAAPFLERVCAGLKPWLPPSLSERLRYH